nr:uncharacterized protein LOC123479789 [Desmodus rotundus]
MNTYKKILKLTPESSRYLCGGDRDKNGGRGWLKRRGRACRGQVGNPTPERTGLCAWGARVEAGVQARPPPLARVQTGSWLPALPTPPFIKRIDNKRRAGAEKWGRGDSKSSKWFRVRGCVLLSPPFQFLRLSEGDPRTRSKCYQSPDNSHSGTGTFTLVRPGSATWRHAQRLPSSFPTARVTVQIEGNAAVPLRFPGRDLVPTGSHPSLLGSFTLLSQRRTRYVGDVALRK